MRLTSPWCRIGLCGVVLGWAGGTALADGAPLGASRESGVVGQVTFRCQGGVVVQVTKFSDRARVNFAGQSRTLNLAAGEGNVRYRSAGFAWVNDGKTAYMQDTRSGRLTVRGCVQVN